MAGFAINATVLRQKGQEFYCFGMNSAVLKRICFVVPRGDEAPTEIQRMMNKRRAKEIGDYIKKETSFLPGAIVVSLTENVRIEASGSEGIKVLHFPDEEGKFAYVLDGQHRLAGFDYSDGLKLDLPVVAIWHANIDIRGKIFADINSKQVPVSDVQLLSLYYQIRDLPHDEIAVVDVVVRLNGDDDSPIKGKIKMMTEEKGTWVRNTMMKRWLAPHLGCGGVLSRKTVAEQASIFKEYFKAIKELWPHAWGNIKDYNLCHPIGLEIFIGIFSSVKQRCDLNEGRQYTVESFSRQMEVIRGSVLDLPGGGKLPLDWERGTMGLISNQTARLFLIRQMKDILHIADEEE